MKVCSKCKIEKGENGFRITTKYILSWCKSCEAEYKAKYYRDNIDKIKKRDKEYKLRHKSKRKQYGEEYYQKNKEIITIKNRELRKKNREKYLVTQKKWNENNREKVAAIKRNCFIRNREKFIKANKDYEKKTRADLGNSYVVKKLKNKGYSIEDIEQVPALMEIQKIKILNHRIKNQK